jgi:5-methylcytosine-specific restriction protein B
MATDLKALSTSELLDAIWAGIKRYKESGEWKSGKITVDRQMVHEAMDEIGSRIEKACPELIQQGYETKVGKGVGRFPKTPWISLLPPKQTTSSGIYGVACINGDGDGYVVGPITSVSDKEISRGIKTIKRPKAEIRVDVGDYNDAFASFREVTRAEVLENDFVQLIIKAAIEADKIRVSAPNTSDETYQSLTAFRQTLDHGQVLLSCLSAKPFAILAGGTGTGKTRTAKLVAASIAGSGNVEVIAVGADWTDNRATLGFRNLLAEGGKAYVAPPALRIILKALSNPGSPFFLILDEMNLSHVERYFADFLSSMESKEKLRLHDCAEALKTEDGLLIEGKVAWPNNLYVIGTVNIDETTYMFSPKVLDRAHVIEFKVSWDEIVNGLEGAVTIEPSLLSLEQVDEFMRVSRLREKSLTKKDHDLLTDVLEDLHAALEGTRFVFAHRTARECLNFIASAQALAKADIVPPLDTKDLIDLAILQKALPKLNGASGTLSKVLEDIVKVSDKHDLGRCKEKLESMSRQLKADQFVSFIN